MNCVDQGVHGAVGQCRHGADRPGQSTGDRCADVLQCNLERMGDATGQRASHLIEYRNDVLRHGPDGLDRLQLRSCVAEQRLPCPDQSADDTAESLRRYVEPALDDVQRALGIVHRDRDAGMEISAHGFDDVDFVTYAAGKTAAIEARARFGPGAFIAGPHRSGSTESR